MRQSASGRGSKNKSGTGRGRQQYSNEFKDNAVHFVLDKGESIGGVAHDLDLKPATLARWVKQAREALEYDLTTPEAPYLQSVPRQQPISPSTLVGCLVCGKQNRFLITALELYSPELKCGACGTPLIGDQAVSNVPADVSTPAPGHRIAVCNWCLKEKSISITSLDSQCSECAEAFPSTDEDEVEADDSDERTESVAASRIPASRRRAQNDTDDRDIAIGDWLDRPVETRRSQRLKHFVIGFAVLLVGAWLLIFAGADITIDGAYVIEENCVDDIEVEVGSRGGMYANTCVEWGEPSHTPFAIWLQDLVFLGFEPVRWLALAFLASLYAAIRAERA